MTKEFWKAALIRAIHTMAQTLLAVLPVGVGIEQVQWFHVLSTAVMAAIISLLKSIAVGVPEVEGSGE